MKFFVNGKKTTKKALVEKLGKEEVERLIKQAKETFYEDPYIDNTVWNRAGFVRIELI